MKGIDPYIETGGACHWAGRVVAWGLRVDVGIDPYIETIGACHSSNRFHVESILSLSENIIT